jgi:asparagine synthase (glutamine-hydrolysing)
LCGICGIVNGSGEPVEADVLLRMREALIHRGPDDGGSHIDGPVGLAMRRLSIIDLDTGHQPIFNEDGTVCVVFNGEIYNYRELREGLIARGHHFSTQTDTEVVVHLYEERGTGCVEQLNGMFALAIWDSRRQQLFLARDRLGIKPLFTAQVGNTFLFASELKSILEHPAIEREVDPIAISEYLTYEYVPAPRTAFRGIKKVPPAASVLWRDGVARTESYWDVAFRPDPALRDEAACAEAIRGRLKEAVRLQLRSDVP